MSFLRMSCTAVLAALVPFATVHAALWDVRIIDNDWNTTTSVETFALFGGTGTYSSNFHFVGGPVPSTPDERPYRNVIHSNPFAHQDSYSVTTGELATFTFTGLPAGDYRVWTFHRKYGLQDTAAPHRIFDGTASGTLLGTQVVNQNVHSAGFVFNDVALTGANLGFAWLQLTTGATQPLSAYQINSGSLTVQIGHGNSVTRADAIRIEQVPEPAAGVAAAIGLAASALTRRRRGQ